MYLDPQWFTNLFGFEESPEAVRTWLQARGGELRSSANGRSFRYGALQLATLGELRKATAMRLPVEGRLSVEQVVNDAQALHADPGNAHALFQVASQFNLLEMAGPNVTPEAGVAGYVFDRTQGPACAIACAAGTVYRNYFVAVNGQVGQSAENQIDCLDLLATALHQEEMGLWQMRSGYLLSNREALCHLGRELASRSPAERDQLKGLVKVGIQWNTEVTLPGCGHVVSQVFCAALPVAYSHVEAAIWEPFARFILEATYEATFHAAILNAEKNRSRLLYLTLVGGGAFGNEPAWILDAIRQALLKFRDAPLDVRIVSFRQPDPMVEVLLNNLGSADH